jgi:hypothetical protein
VGIINNEQISASTSKGTANANSKVLTVKISTPSRSRLAVRLKLNLRKNVMVTLASDQISHPTTEVHRQIGSVGRHDDLLLRVFA